MSILALARRVVVSAGLAWAGVTVTDGAPAAERGEAQKDCAPFCEIGAFEYDPKQDATPQKNCLSLGDVSISTFFRQR